VLARDNNCEDDAKAVGNPIRASVNLDSHVNASNGADVKQHEIYSSTAHAAILSGGKGARK